MKQKAQFQKYLSWSQIYVNTDSCSKEWKEIHWNVNRVHIWMVKLPMNFPLLCTFLFSNFCPRAGLFHDWKKTCFIFLNSCLSVSAIENTSHWIYGDCKVGQHILSGTDPRIHTAKSFAACPAPGEARGSHLLLFLRDQPSVISKWAAASFATQNLGQVPTPSSLIKGWKERGRKGKEDKEREREREKGPKSFPS